MMAEYGVTATGFVKKRLADIKTEREASLRNALGNYINLLPESVFGQLIGIGAERESLLWELMEDVYNSRIPSAASGVSLDNVLELSGLERLDEAKSRINDQLLFGTPGSPIPAGTQFSVDGNPDAKFVTLNDVVLGAGADEIQTIGFSATPASGAWALSFKGEATSSLAYNANAAAIQAALRLIPGLEDIMVSGSYGAGFAVTFAGSAGKQDQDLLVVSANTMQSSVPASIVTTVATTTAGVPQAIVDLEATEDGPTDAPAGTLTVIDTPVTGLDSTFNPADAVLGRDIETDLEARSRRARTLQVAGAGTPEAIRSRMLELVGVTDVIVFENDSDITDVDGRPEHSYEVVVNGGDDQEIADLIWESKPAGIATFGNQTTAVIDSEGATKSVNWSRPTLVPIFLSIDLTTDPTFPANGIATVKQLLLDFGIALGIAKDVIVYPKLVAAVDSVPGILDMVIRIDTAAVSTTPGAPAQDDNLDMAANEISDWDLANININVI